MNTDHFKTLLETEKQTLQKELSTVGRKNPEQKGDWEATEPEMNTDRADETEVADSITEFENNSAVLDQLEARLTEVNIALDKIAKGVYGVCEIGCEQIEEDRLEANPAAKTCKAHME